MSTSIAKIIPLFTLPWNFDSEIAWRGKIIKDRNWLIIGRCAEKNVVPIRGELTAGRITKILCWKHWDCLYCPHADIIQLDKTDFSK